MITINAAIADKKSSAIVAHMETERTLDFQSSNL